MKTITKPSQVSNPSVDSPLFHPTEPFLLVNFRGEPSLLAPYLTQHKGPWVYFGSFLPSRLEKYSTHGMLSESLLSRQDCQAMDQWVWDLTRSWYKNVTSLGEFVEFDLQLYLFKKVKNLVLLDHLVSHYHPKTLYCCDTIGDLWPVVSSYSQQHPIKCQRLFVKGDSPNPWEVGKGIRDWGIDLLTNGLDSWARFLLKNSRVSLTNVSVDQRLLAYLGTNQQEFRFIPCILEKGLRVRLAILRKGQFYFALQNKSRSQFSWISLPCFNRFYQLWKQCDQDESFRRQFVFQDLNLYPMVREEIKTIFLNDFPRVEKNKNRLRHLIKKLQPAAMLLRNELKELEKSCIIAAKGTKMRSIVLQHGINAIPILDEKNVCDFRGVWGEYEAQRLIQKGTPKEKCVILGNLEYDGLADSLPLRVCDREIRSELGFSTEEPMVVLASQRAHGFSSTKTEDEPYRLLRAILKAIEGLDRLQLVIKAHPYEDERPLQRLVNEFHLNRRVHVIKKMDLFSLLTSADLVIVYNSTVGLTAMILGKPVMVVNLTAYPDTVNYVSSLAAVGVYQEKEIALTLSELLLGGFRCQEMLKAQKQFIQDHAFQIDGKARERLFQLLKDLASVRPSCGS